MNKIIAIAGIIGAFAFGILTANPVVEAVGGWQAAIANHDTRLTELETAPGVDDLTVIQRENSVFIQERGICPIAPGCPAETRQVQTVSVDCLADEIVTGGGWFHDIPLAKVFIAENRQVGNGWQVTGFNSQNGDAGVTLTVYAECLSTP